MSKPMTYYEWLEFMGIEEDTDESYDAFLEAKRNMCVKDGKAVFTNA